MLSPAEQDRVEEAIRAAEAGTAGEIVVIVSRQAGRYRSVPLAAALLGALAIPWPLIWLTQASAARIGLAQLGLVCLIILAFALTQTSLSLVPRRLKREAGHAAARREFAARGLADTRGRTGVLIFIAVAERYAEVIGDKGISDRLGEDVWRATLTGLVEALHEGRAADGLVEAVGRVGALLAQQVPRRADDADELPNRVILM